MNYKAVCASIVLAIDLLQAPDGRQVSEDRKAILGFLESLAQVPKVSELCHRAEEVLKLLLQRDSENELWRSSSMGPGGTLSAGVHLSLSTSGASKSSSADLDKEVRAPPPLPFESTPDQTSSAMFYSPYFMGDLSAPPLAFATLDNSAHLASNTDPYAIAPPPHTFTPFNAGVDTTSALVDQPHPNEGAGDYLTAGTYYKSNPYAAFFLVSCAACGEYAGNAYATGCTVYTRGNLCVTAGAIGVAMNFLAYSVVPIPPQDVKPKIESQDTKPEIRLEEEDSKPDVKPKVEEEDVKPDVAWRRRRSPAPVRPLSA
ncbi:hypothetical protein RQP46_001498 [Phenoliferia psychrophenolica]